MTKREMIGKVAEETGLSKAASKKAIDSVVFHIVNTLKTEKRFLFYGLGVFEVVDRQKRMARNPKTNQPVEVEAHKAVKFKPSRLIKSLIN